MDWGHTSLSGLLGYQEEVEALVALAVLDEVGVDDGSWLRVEGLSELVLAEHSLVDSLVDDDKGDRWRA